MNSEPFHKLITAVEEALERFRKAAEQSVGEAAALILASPGKVVVTGVGKSGIVGHKTAATLASTGTPAVFLNAGEALHGDMGVVCKGDVVVLISNSGETEELLRILPSLRKIGVRTIGLLGKPESTLAGHLDLVIPVEIGEEGEAMNLAPMCSTALSLVAGDTLAATLLAEREFGEEEYAVLHPGGFLGRRLLLCASDVMQRRHQVATLGKSASLQDVVTGLTKFPLGLVCVVGEGDAILGVITDGDVRRTVMEKRYEDSAESMMTRTPVTIRETDRLARVLEIMENPRREIYAVPVVNEDDCLVGVVRMHDVLGS
ncbi:MAG: KpsF/GutQ family sugar-phosphate isomerase [Roseibacillus sp.]|jgi:arabinose-5-phosphate isomerase|nr:KpsF/GutQ family sugar-phosphate isomerase [Roseibacillus sp.]